MTTAIRLGRATFAAALASSLALVAVSYRLPYHDAHNHLVRFTQLAALLFGTAEVRCATFLPVLTPYIGLDLVGAALVHLTSPAIAFKAVAMLSLITFSLGFLALVLSAGHDRWAIAAVGPALALGWFFIIGFESYLVGLGLWMGWTAWWLRTRGTGALRHAVPIALAILGLFVFHLTAVLFAMLVVGADVVATTLAVLRGRQNRGALRVVAIRAVLAVVVAGGAWVALQHGALASWAGAQTASTVTQKLARLGTPFVTFSAAQGAAAALPYALGLVIVVAQLRGTLASSVVHPCTIASAGALVAYFVFPTTFNGVAHVDQRFIIPALVLPFALPVAPATTAPQRGWVLALAVAVAIHVAVLWRITGRIERWFRTADALFAEIPIGSRVLAIRPGNLRVGRIEPLGFYDQWLVTEGRAQVPGVFSWPGDRHLAHFRLTCDRYDVTWNWRPGQDDLDWPRIAKEDDYIVALGLADSTRRALEGHADLVALRDGMALYRTRR